jgi:hypothetical protein
MKGNRKPYHRKPRPKTENLSDLEVAKKMLKIYQSAIDRKLDFDLSFETVRNLLLEPTCYYTQKVFEETGNFARSFDRINSDLGYVEGNVVACTVDINSKKSNLSYEEIEILYRVLSKTKTSDKKEKSETKDEITNAQEPSEEKIAEDPEQSLS